MKLYHIVRELERFAPRQLQESWDNSGLQIGLPPGCDEVTGVLICLDVTPDTIAEAVALGCNLVVSHHPLIFRGLRHITGGTPAELAVQAAIASGVAVYSAHTSLDSTAGGISQAMAAKLGAEVVDVLSPRNIAYDSLRCVCPPGKATDFALALGNIEGARDVATTPTSIIDIADDENGIPVATGKDAVICSALIPANWTAHAVRVLADIDSSVKVYTESATSRSDNNTGLGVVAVLRQPVTMAQFTVMLRDTFGTGAIRCSLEAADSDRMVRRVALCGGSGGEFIGNAIASGADAYVTADIRYHDFADHRDDIALFDIGHFESENCAKDILMTLICGKFPNFAVHKSKQEKNPVIYL